MDWRDIWKVECLVSGGGRASDAQFLSWTLDGGAGSSCLNFEVLAWRQLVDIWVARAQERGFHWKYRLGDQHLRDENQSHSKGNL